jgi:hypothetical protein
VGVTFIALGLLACAWAVLLVPDLRNRGSSGGRANSVKSFQDQLSGLDRTRPQHQGARPAPRGVRPGPVPGARPGGPTQRPVRGTATGAPARGPVRRAPLPAPRASSPFVPRSRAEAAQRRLLVLAVLVGLSVLTFLAALVGPRVLLFVHLLVDAALAAYAYLLWERASRSRARHSSLVTLSTMADDDTDLVLRRRASGS